MRRLVVAGVALALVSSGCARNGVLEVELTLPPLPATETELYAVPYFRTGEFTFDAQLVDPSFDGTLLSDTVQEVAYSVDTERVDGSLRLAVVFCERAGCDGEDTMNLPQVWYDFEHATYIGQRTRWTAVIDEVPAGRPTDATCVDRCEIEGCIAGSGSFCRADGTHFCADPGSTLDNELCDF